MTGREARPRKTYDRRRGQAEENIRQADRPGRGKHMTGTGRLKGSTAYRRPARPMKSRPVWISDTYIQN